MTGDAFRKLALSFAGAEARPHFDRTAFRTTRKTFATLSADGSNVNLMLEPDVQAELTETRPAVFQPCPGGWGRMGWTTMMLAKVSATEARKILADAHALALPRSKRTR